MAHYCHLLVALCPNGLHLLYNDGDSYCVFVSDLSDLNDCSNVSTFCTDYFGGDATAAIMSTTTLIQDYTSLVYLCVADLVSDQLTMSVSLPS